MKLSGPAKVAGILVLILGLPALSLLIMKKGADIRANAEPSPRLHNDTSSIVPDYFFISHRGDTITRERMKGKVCVVQFISDSTMYRDTSFSHRLFDLQEAYYGKTLSLRILSVTLTPQTQNEDALEHESELFSTREEWHVLRSDSDDAQQLLTGCVIKEPNNAPASVFYIIDKRSHVRAHYNPSDPKDYDAVYKDILYLIGH